jgi:hypothetical protein
MDKRNYDIEFGLYQQNETLREFESVDDKIVLEYNANENDYVVRSCINRRLKFRIFPLLEDANNYFEQLKTTALGEVHE